MITAKDVLRHVHRVCQRSDTKDKQLLPCTALQEAYRVCLSLVHVYVNFCITNQPFSYPSCRSNLTKAKSKGKIQIPNFLSRALTSASVVATIYEFPNGNRMPTTLTRLLRFSGLRNLRKSVIFKLAECLLRLKRQKIPTHSIVDRVYRDASCRPVEDQLWRITLLVGQASTRCLLQF